jgi:hypothetical protein
MRRQAFRKGPPCTLPGSVQARGDKYHRRCSPWSWPARRERRGAAHARGVDGLEAVARRGVAGGHGHLASFCLWWRVGHTNGGVCELDTDIGVGRLLNLGFAVGRALRECERVVRSKAGTGRRLLCRTVARKQLLQSCRWEERPGIWACGRAREAHSRGSTGPAGAVGRCRWPVPLAGAVGRAVGSTHANACPWPVSTGDGIMRAVVNDQAVRLRTPPTHPRRPWGGSAAPTQPLPAARQRVLPALFQPSWHQNILAIASAGCARAPREGGGHKGRPDSFCVCGHNFHLG